MTKDKIIDIMQKHWHQDGYYTASFDSDGCAGELLSLVEQEKKELLALFEQESKEIALSVVQDVKRNLGLNTDLHLIDGFNQRIEQEKHKLAKEIFLLLQSRFCMEGTSDGWEYSISQLAFEQIALDNFGIDIKNIGESEENKDDERTDN